MIPPVDILIEVYIKNNGFFVHTIISIIIQKKERFS